MTAAAFLAGGLALAGTPGVFRPDGMPTAPAYFPLAVWCQAPANAARFRAAGINLYVALWQGPTAAQLDALKQAGMPVVCDQNAVGLARHADPVIAAWMHGDEPDNAQELPKGQEGYGPPIAPARIVADYRRLRKADPSRPVMLNLGQGVAWDGWYGRGVRTNHPEDYAAYARGSDIASFDIYPAVHDRPGIAGRLELVPFGVARLRGWAPGKPVWACIEASRISNTAYKVTGEQLRYEVWAAVTAGARGIIYFVHQFAPVFREASLLDDAPLLAAVTAVNRDVLALAPFLNAPDAARPVAVTTDPPGVPVAVLDKRRGAEERVLVCTLRRAAAPVRFALDRPAALEAEERLDGYDVRRYRLTN